MRGKRNKAFIILLCLGGVVCSGLTVWGQDDDDAIEATCADGAVLWVDVEPAKRLRILTEVELPVSEDEQLLVLAAESLELGEEERTRAWEILRESAWPDDSSFWNALLYGAFYLDAKDKLILFTRAVEELEKRSETERDADWYWFLSYSLMGKGLVLPRGEAIETFSKSLETTHQAARLFEETGRNQLMEAAWRQVASLEEMFGSIYFSYDKAIAEKHYKKFFETMQSLVEKDGSSENVERLRVARLKWADTLWHVGEREKAMEFYQIVENDLDAMDRPLETWSAAILSISLQTVSQWYLVHLQFPEAIALQERAGRWEIALLNHSRRDFPSADFFYFYAAEEALARLLLSDMDRMNQYFDRVTKLLETYGSPQQRQNWKNVRLFFDEIGEELISYEANIVLSEIRRGKERANLVRRLAQELHRHGQSPAAVMAALHEGVRILRKHTDDRFLREDYLVALGHLGQLYLYGGWWKDAEDTLASFNQEARRETAGFAQDPQFRLLRANALLGLAEVRHLLDENNSSTELINEALDIFNALAREGFLEPENRATWHALQRGEWSPRLRSEWQMSADSQGRAAVSLLLKEMDGRGSIGLTRSISAPAAVR